MAFLVRSVFGRLRRGPVLGASAPARASASAAAGPPVVQVDHSSLVKMEPAALAALRRAFVGPKAYGAIAVVNIPGYKEKRLAAFRAGADLALKDPEGRKRAAAVSNTYPGWSGEPGRETHPLQSSFLYNAKEELTGKVDPYFGKNIFPSDDFHRAFRDLARPMHEAAMQVLRGCDKVMEDVMQDGGLKWSEDGRSLYDLADKGPALAGRFICYDSGFTREDKLLKETNTNNNGEYLPPGDDGGNEDHAGAGVVSTQGKSAGHASDGLASMRTHTTPVKSAGHAGDGLASMRTHSTPVKSAGHAGDGLASMRTHSTPVKSAGHAGDGLASMRTHSTPVKSAGHAGDGLASMRTHSMQLKSATPTQAVGNLAEVKRAGDHARTQHAQVSTTAMPPSDPMYMPDDFDSLASAVRTTELAETEAVSPKEESDHPGEYWLPWHIDSNFITLIHKEKYAHEGDATWAPDPEGAGVMVMNKDGDVAMLDCPEDALIVQFGAFGQIYAGGHMAACRHAVLNPRPPGVARFNYCNFWYAKWHTPCTVPEGREAMAVNTGWNAMMDSSYIGITMKQGFAAFRRFMTSPEARVQYQDTVLFKELSELVPTPTAHGSTGEILVDLLTDIRCPYSYIALLHFRQAVQNLQMQDKVRMRYHPVFLNPNVPKEGESLDDYLLREYGIDKKIAHSKDYPLYRAGLEAGVRLNPHRRVVNTFDAFCLLELAEREGLEDELFEELSRRYFEDAKDISDPSVLAAAADAIGLRIADAAGAIAEPGLRARIWHRYQELAAAVGEVPLFLLREGASGSGAEATGTRTPEAWQGILADVLEKGRFMGMSVAGIDGRQVWLAGANPNSPISLSFAAQHGWFPNAWPLAPEDFQRYDESDDQLMYSKPRIGVNHLDDASLQNLTEVYRTMFSSAFALQATSSPTAFSVLDLCSSWTSHFPAETLANSRVVVHGLNEEELLANSVATERVVQNLNDSPILPFEGDSFDFVTLALSVQYLTKPKEVFAEMHRVLRPGGVALVAFSHRSFIEKCVGVWAREPDDGEGHALLVRTYFLGSVPQGWQEAWSADVSPRHGDPLWIVGAVKPGCHAA